MYPRVPTYSLRHMIACLWAEGSRCEDSLSVAQTCPQLFPVNQAGAELVVIIIIKSSQPHLIANQGSMFCSKEESL